MKVADGGGVVAVAAGECVVLCSSSLSFEGLFLRRFFFGMRGTD